MFQGSYLGPSSIAALGSSARRGDTVLAQVAESIAMPVDIGHGGGGTVDCHRRSGARSEHATCGIEARAARVDARWRTGQKVRGPNDDLALTKEAGELVLAERKDFKLLLEWNAFHQSQARHDLRIINVLFQKPGVSVVVRAPKENVAAVVVV